MLQQRGCESERNSSLDRAELDPQRMKGELTVQQSGGRAAAHRYSFSLNVKKL